MEGVKKLSQHSQTAIAYLADELCDGSIEDLYIECSGLSVPECTELKAWAWQEMEVCGI